MKSYRHILITCVLTLCVFGSIVYTSCKNKCGSTTCQNGGSCESNICICPTGYSGNACQTSWSGPAIGTYNCTRANCHPAVLGANTWQSSVTVDATNGGYTIDFSNFAGSNTTVVATIDSSYNGISKITISASAGINATGQYDSSKNTINLNYTSYSAGTSVGCSMVMVKEL